MACEQMTDEQKAFCVRTAQWMDKVKTFPGGARFLSELFQEIVSAQGLTVVDQHDPSVSIRREIVQELYDVLWATRELRESGYTMQTAGKLGLADLYAAHGSQALVRWIKLTTDNALHNAGLDGFKLSEVRNQVN